MSTRTMLVPNPNRGLAIDRVIVVGASEDHQRLLVLDIDALNKNPTLMQPYGAGFRWATAFWKLVGALALLGGVALAFSWHWWALVLGAICSAMVINATRRSTADFAAEILASNKDALAQFAQLGLLWEAPSQSVVPASVGAYPSHLKI